MLLQDRDHVALFLLFSRLSLACQTVNQDCSIRERLKLTGLAPLNPCPVYEIGRAV